MKTTLPLILIRATFAPIITAIALSGSALAQPSPPRFIKVDTGGVFLVSNGGGASWGDYDGDGDVDLFVTKVPDNVYALYRNLGDGSFDRPGADQIGDLAGNNWISPQGVFADINNDGHLDLYVPGRRAILGGPLSNDHIYWNDGHGSFALQEVAGTSDESLFPHGASMADFDNDGDLDLLERTLGSAGLALPEALLRNDGNGVFSRLEVQNAPLTRFANTAAWADYDGDGDLDAFVVNNVWGGGATPSYIFKNLLSESGAAAFEAITGGPEARGIQLETSAAGFWGDLDNDGDLDLVTMPFDRGFRIHRRNEAGQYDSEPYYVSGGMEILYCTMLDAENDGDLDLLVKVVGSTYRLIVNAGDGRTFTEEAFAGGQRSTAGWPAVGDFNNDGYSDVFVAYHTAPGDLFQNEGGPNHWLKLLLKGTVSNSSAVGAIVRVSATISGKSVWQMRQVAAGGETYRVQHDMRPNFGLGDATVAEVVRIEWPSGVVQELTNVAADQILTVIEPPRLRVEADGRISWPVTADEYRLESAIFIKGPWAETSELAQTNGSRKSITIQPDGGAKFYRLNRQ